MSIRYGLHKNRLSAEGAYIARVRSAGSADLDEVVERMMAQGSTVTRADALQRYWRPMAP